MSLFRRDQGTGGVEDDLATHLLSQDLIYVGGGNVLSMLGAWRAHGLDAILRKAWRRGIVLCGPSAGSLCWFDQALSAFHGAPRPVRGLGLLPYSNCVHYDAEPARRAEYHRAVADGMCGGFAADDGVALHFQGTSLERVVSSRPDGSAYSVELDGRRVRERRLDVTYLGAAGGRPKRPKLALGSGAAAAWPPCGRWLYEPPQRRSVAGASDLRHGGRRLHDGAQQPPARRLRALARPPHRATHPVPAHRLRRHHRPDQRLQGALRPPHLRARAHLPVSHARDQSSSQGDRDGAGHRLRGRRLDAQPARHLAAPTISTSCSSRPGSRASCSPA